MYIGMYIQGMCMYIQGTHILGMYIQMHRDSVSLENQWTINICWQQSFRPTQSIIYVHCLIARFQELFLLIVENKTQIILLGASDAHQMRIWSSAQYYVVLGFLLNQIGFCISARPKWSGKNVLYQLGTSSQRAHWWGWPFNICSWFMRSGGIAVIIWQ